MESCISYQIAEFRKTRNPLYLAKALLLIAKQKRIHELAYGIYCHAIFKPSIVASNPYSNNLQSVIHNGQSFTPGAFVFSREQLIDVFGRNYAVHQLPADFCCARSESIVCDQDFLIIGEYGNCNNAKRLFCVTQQSCDINDYYKVYKHIIHIHAVYKSTYSRDVLVTTGDSVKRLDLWCLKNGKLVFEKTLRNSLAGYTAITMIGGMYYVGSDFSARPNYIERLGSGKKFFFPKPAYKMLVVAFQEYLNRYIVAISTTISFLGNQWALSVFDTVTEYFVYCDNIDLKKNTANKALHRMAIPLRSIAAGELGR